LIDYLLILLLMVDFSPMPMPPVSAAFSLYDIDAAEFSWLISHASLSLLSFTLPLTLLPP